MFSAISRYRRLPDVVTMNGSGRVVASKSLRLLPDVAGRFLHTVQDIDRLDHLAYKYYDQPRDWWRIVDANPAFLAPDALLGAGPLVTVQVPVTFDGPSPPWSDLLRALRAQAGVDSAVLGLPDRGHAAVAIVQGPLAFDIAPALTTQLDASTRTQATAVALEAALLVEGVSLSADLRIAKLDAVTWRITDAHGPRVLTFRHFPADDLLNVYESAFRFEWAVTATYNRAVIAAAQLLAVMIASGFAPGPASEVQRVGKPIVIPPRRT